MWVSLGFGVAYAFGVMRAWVLRLVRSLSLLSLELDCFDAAFVPLSLSWYCGT